MHHRSAVLGTPFKSLATGVALLASCAINAADHQEAPNASAQLLADIGDYYAWVDAGQLNLIVTFNTFLAPGTEASYDSNLLYGFHFDTSETADGVSDVDMYVRFAQDVEGNWGLQVSDTDDVAVLSGAVETVLTEGAVSAWAGLADDPFFFDQEGFIETTTTGTLSFDSTRDSVAGANIQAIALQMPVANIAADGSAFQTWSTTASQ